MCIYNVWYVLRIVQHSVNIIESLYLAYVLCEQWGYSGISHPKPQVSPCKFCWLSNILCITFPSQQCQVPPPSLLLPVYPGNHDSTGMKHCTSDTSSLKVSDVYLHFHLQHSQLKVTQNVANGCRERFRIESTLLALVIQREKTHVTHHLSGSNSERIPHNASNFNC